MEKLLDRAKELVTELRAKVDEADKRKADLDRQEAKLIGFKNELEQIAASLASREVEVKRVEDLLALRKEAKEAKAEADRARAALEGYNSQVKQEIANERAKLQIERQSVAESRAAQRKEYEQLNKDKIKLKEDQKNIKENVMKELRAKVGA